MKLSAFEQARPVVAPARVVVLEPTDFADSWTARPKKSVAVGLRRLSEREEQTVFDEAFRAAAQAMAEVPEDERQARFVHVFNETTLAVGVGRAVCDPNDVAREAGPLPMAEATVGDALRSGTLRRLFEALEAVAVETSPLYRQAADDELEALAWALLDGRVADLEGPARSRARRFAAFILDELSDDESEDESD